MVELTEACPESDGIDQWSNLQPLVGEEEQVDVILLLLALYSANTSHS